MNGAHDLGGMHGFDEIAADPQEPVFFHDWERRVFALTLAMGARGHWNLDMSRFARESSDPGIYLTTTYYEHWLHGLENLLERFDLASTDALGERMRDLGAAASPLPPDERALRREQVAKSLGRGQSARLQGETPAKFRVGDHIMTTNDHPQSHTRLPRYARGRQGIVVGIHGHFIFPDRHADDGTKQPEVLYNVRFDAQTLWGANAESAHDGIYIDVFEPYLRS